jgi:hypothetical protein
MVICPSQCLAVFYDMLELSEVKDPLLSRNGDRVVDSIQRHIRGKGVRKMYFTKEYTILYLDNAPFFYIINNDIFFGPHVF